MQPGRRPIRAPPIFKNCKTGLWGQGREYEQCHATEAVKTLAASEKFVPAVWKNGELEFYKGIIPLAPDLLDWPFLEKKNGNWIPFEPEQEPLIQLGVYALPFTNTELEKLARKQTYEE